MSLVKHLVSQKTVDVMIFRNGYTCRSFFIFLHLVSCFLVILCSCAFLSYIFYELFLSCFFFSISFTQSLFDTANVSYTNYIRTTEDRHTHVVQDVWVSSCV